MQAFTKQQESKENLLMVPITINCDFWVKVNTILKVYKLCFYMEIIAKQSIL